MLNKDLSLWIISLLIGVSISCSTTKKGFVNKNYHALITKYNVLFNGKEAYSVGETILFKAFEENFYDLLPVEPITLRGENFDQTTIVPGFERAEEKAVKAIQKHSIKIEETQYNTQIDEAYMLLGKARYFDRRFFPALEAFNFLLESGANPNVYLEGKIWREKTNIRLNNIELAVENMSPLVQSLSEKNKLYPLANATLADAYIQLKQLDSASFYIQRAANHEPKRKNKARYLFISGQLLEKLTLKDSAFLKYTQINKLNRKAPRNILIQAKIKEIQLTSILTPKEKRDRLDKLLKNYENESFEHKIHRAIAMTYLKEGKDSLALVYFQKSLQAPLIDSFTEIENYQELAAYYFQNGFYLKTGQYLDRLLLLFEPSTSRYNQLKRQRDNLTDIILYEEIIKETDSILGILSMSKDEQIEFFKNHIKEKQLIAKKINEDSSNNRGDQFLKKYEGSFYFYNPNLILQGKQNYLAKWGNRPNVDNWRSTFAIENISLTNKNNSADLNLQSQKFKITPESFVISLPKTKAELDSIKMINHKAYLQLGMIYKEKFKNFYLAKSRLDYLISQKTVNEIKAQALYHLFRMAAETNSTTAKKYKKALIEGYPMTPFAQLISNLEDNDIIEQRTPEQLYKKALTLFKKQHFIEALEEIEPLMVLAGGSPIEPKTALLKAHIIGRLKGVDEWKKALAQVLSNYSATKEAKSAKSIVEKIELNNNLKETGIIYKNYKWIFPFSSSESFQANFFLEQLKEILKTSKRRWTVSLDLLNEEHIFIVVHGIRDPKQIKRIENNSVMSELIKQNSKNFVALASQYRTIMKNKNWKIFQNEGN